MTTSEVNFDGIVGPTHNYAGLSFGNKASMSNQGETSSPKAAALQGLTKMRFMVDLGLTQAVLPPQQRPDPVAVAALGHAPQTPVADLPDELVPTLMSAACMWAANAATVSPSADTADGRVHFTPANLSTTAHRSFEHPQTTAMLRAIFADSERFVVHDALPAHSHFADEGAANHGRLTSSHGETGVHLFVYGREADEAVGGRFPRRQTKLASELIARSHGLNSDRVLFVAQSDTAIDAGAFHNDVVSVVNENVVFYHQDAFAEPIADAPELASATFVEVHRDAVPIEDAVSSYLFNSQFVTLPDATMALIAPADVDATASAAAYCQRAVADPNNPIAAVHTFDLHESMSNGGGPACLRLRVALTEEEIGSLSGSVLVDHDKLDDLEGWVNQHYRDELSPADLWDPALVEESNRALDELTQLLDLGALYPLQR